jgi:hypothetical protein
MIGEGMNVLAMLPTEQMIACSILVAMLGMIVLWKWEGIGGLLVIFGMACFYLLGHLLFASCPGGWVLLLCFLPGVFAILSWASTIEVLHEPKTLVCQNSLVDFGSSKAST